MLLITLILNSLKFLKMHTKVVMAMLSIDDTGLVGLKL